MKSSLQLNIEEATRLLPGLLPFAPELARSSEKLASALLSGDRLLACGNGGSAAEASHMTTEFVCRFDRDRRPFAAILLTANGGDLTAIGNDYIFADSFACQVQCSGRPGDVLAAFSTSGASENVVRALSMARQTRVFSIAFLGRGGGRCAGLADAGFTVAGEKTARIQEAHMLLMHTLCEMVEERLFAAEADRPVRDSSAA